MPHFVIERVLGGPMRSRISIIAALMVMALGAAAGSAVAAIPDPDGGHANHTSVTGRPDRLAPSLARARLATAQYVTDLDRAKATGYRIITPMMPDMGYHFLDPEIQGFDVERPPILVYVRRGETWQLVALEWVFTERPAQPPLPGARYGSFAAACHYEDGTFIVQTVEHDCAAVSPETDARFSFWHPPLVTLHLWAWYPNPRGIFNGTNPLVRPFNE